MTRPTDPPERALALGSDQSLVAVATRDARPRQALPRRPTVIYLNAGVLHRVGPHRLHVVLARRLAALGFPGLRVDLSGIGDSRPVPGDRTFRESAVDDTRVAMDHLARAEGDERFVLFGLCAGADNALATAAVDPRVTALVLVDPPAYRTRRARLRAVARRARGLGGAAPAIAWLSRAAARRARATASRVLARASRQGAPDDDAPAPGRQPPPPEEYRALLGELTGRGVRVLSVYSGALGDAYNAEGQLFEAFPDLRGRVDVAYFPDANHVFTERAAQAALVDTVVRWLERTFP